MENNIGNSIKSKIEMMRNKIEKEIEVSQKSLIESLRDEEYTLLKGINAREKELLRRVEQLHDRELSSSRWKMYALTLLIGVMIGFGGATVWAFKKAQAFQNDNGTTTLWLRIWTTKKGE